MAHCPAKMLKTLGLVDGSGNQVASKSVSVTFTNFIPDDDDDDDDDDDNGGGGGGGSSDMGVDEGEVIQIQPNLTHAGDDVSDGVASPTHISNNRYTATRGSRGALSCRTHGRYGYSVHGRVTSYRTDPHASFVYESTGDKR